MSRKKLRVAARPQLPEGCPNLIKDYKTLAEKAAKFAEGRYNLLVIAGEAGLGKSRIFQEALEGQSFAHVDANASPFGAYVKCYQHRNELVLMDDADMIHEQPSGKRFLKQLCQTEQWKRVSWEAKSLIMSKKKEPPAPPSYYTKSRVCILTNHWDFSGGNVHTAAVEDRGQVYVFAPTALEVHRFVATWFWDQTVFDFIARHIPYLRSPSCRMYTRAEEMLRADDDWQGYILSKMFDEGSTEKAVISLMSSPEFTSNNARADELQKRGHGSRATYYRYRADLAERCKLTEVPNLQVQGSTPEDLPDPMGDIDNDADTDEETDEYDE